MATQSEGPHLWSEIQPPFGSGPFFWEGSKHNVPRHVNPKPPRFKTFLAHSEEIMKHSDDINQLTVLATCLADGVSSLTSRQDIPCIYRTFSNFCGVGPNREVARRFFQAAYKAWPWEAPFNCLWKTWNGRRNFRTWHWENISAVVWRVSSFPVPWEDTWICNKQIFWNLREIWNLRLVHIFLFCSYFLQIGMVSLETRVSGLTFGNKFNQSLDEAGRLKTLNFATISKNYGIYFWSLLTAHHCCATFLFSIQLPF